MIVRVSFSDNDFCNEVLTACENILAEVKQFEAGDNVSKTADKCISEFGLENLRKSIVLASYGEYIAKRGYRGILWKAKYEERADEHIFKYLDEHTKVSVVKKQDENDDNCETVYIDFYRSDVYLR